MLRRADRGNWYLRISAGDDVVEGRILEVEPELVRLAGGGVRLVDVSRIERRHRSGRGALVGALVGGAALGALFFTFAAGVCDIDCDKVPLFGLAGVALGGTVGGLVGALIAPGETWWEELWSGWP